MRSFWRIFKEKLVRPLPKAIILGALTTVIGLLPSILGINGVDTSHWKYVVLVGTAIIYFILLAFYATYETNSRRAVAEREKQIGAHKSLAVNTIDICRRTASKITKCIHGIEDKGEIDLALWNFDTACLEMCGFIYKVVNELCDNKNFEVTYIKLIEGNTQKREVIMNSFANEGMHSPTIYNKSRMVNPIESHGDYHDVDLFRQNKSDIDIRIDPDEVNAVFGYSSKQHREDNHKKYHSYIGIPVFCNDEKMIGLLQVVALHQAQFGVTKEEVEEMAKKFLVPYSYLFLLLHKLEKALIAVPKNKQSGKEVQFCEKEEKD